MLVPFAACGEDSTDDGVVGSVPADARAYLHLDRGSEDWDDASDSLAKLPAIESILMSLLADQVEVPGDGQAGVALLRGRKQPVVFTPEDPPARRSLAITPVYEELIEGLPDQRLATLYLSHSATRRCGRSTGRSRPSRLPPMSTTTPCASARRSGTSGPRGRAAPAPATSCSSSPTRRPPSTWSCRR